MLFISKEISGQDVGKGPTRHDRRACSGNVWGEWQCSQGGEDVAGVQREVTMLVTVCLNGEGEGEVPLEKDAQASASGDQVQGCAIC